MSKLQFKNLTYLFKYFRTGSLRHVFYPRKPAQRCCFDIIKFIVVLGFVSKVEQQRQQLLLTQVAALFREFLDQVFTTYTAIGDERAAARAESSSSQSVQRSAILLILVISKLIKESRPLYGLNLALFLH